MSFSTSKAPAVRVPDQFPAGLRVLVVDDDSAFVVTLEKMLKSCLYDVTICNQAKTALQLLRDNKNRFDIVMIDVRMPGIDGFELVERTGIEMDVPVIMMSADDSTSMVMKGITHGACDYLIKPVPMEALKYIWQHVVRKNKSKWKDIVLNPSAGVENGQVLQKDADHPSPSDEGNSNSFEKRKESEDGDEIRGDASALKKPRVVWSVELHHMFIVALHRLGVEKAVPKKILELMNVPGLTRENVASHLQKYRLHLQRVRTDSPNLTQIGNPTMGNSDVPMFSVNVLNDLQALATSGQLPRRSVAAIQAMLLGGVGHKSSLSAPIAHQPQNLQAIQTYKGSKPLSHNFQQSPSTFHNTNINIQTPETQNYSLPNRGMVQPLQYFGNQNNSLLRQTSNEVMGSSVGLMPVWTQFAHNVDKINPVSRFSPVSVSTTSTLTSKGLLQDVKSEVQGHGGFLPCDHGFSSDQNHNWIQRGKDVSLVQPGITFCERRSEQTGISAVDMSGSNPNIGQELNSYVADSSLVSEMEPLPDMNDFFGESFSPDDLLDLCKPQRDGLGQP